MFVLDGKTKQLVTYLGVFAVVCATGSISANEVALSERVFSFPETRTNEEFVLRNIVDTQRATIRIEFTSSDTKFYQELQSVIDTEHRALQRRYGNINGRLRQVDEVAEEKPLLLAQRDITFSILANSAYNPLPLPFDAGEFHNHAATFKTGNLQ